MPYYRKAKSAAKKVYRKVVKPYVSKKKGYSNRMKLYKEVAAIKRMVNAEKKSKDATIVGAGVAQSNGVSDGAYVVSVTPVIAVGATYEQRNGRSIKCSGLYFRGQIQGQTNQISSIRYNFTFVLVKGAPQTTANILTGMFNADPLSGIRDYFASRNPDQYRDYVIIASRNYTLFPDNITGEQSRCNIMFPLKLRHHIRYDAATAAIQEGEIFLIVRATNGDSAGGALTGGFLNASFRLSYYDN